MCKGAKLHAKKRIRYCRHTVVNNGIKFSDSFPALKSASDSTPRRAASELISNDPKSTLYLHDSYHVTENISLYLLFVRAANIHSYFLQLNHVSHSCAIDMLMCNISLVPIPMTQQRWTT